MNKFIIYERMAEKIKYLVNKRIGLCGLALAFTYILFSMLTLNAWIYSWLNGKYYLFYQMLYMLIIFLLFLFYMQRHKNNLPSLYKILIFGTVAGYFTGIVAYFGAVLLTDFGYERIANSLRISSLWFVLFVPPFMLLSWFFGGVMSLSIAILLRLLDNRVKI